MMKLLLRCRLASKQFAPRHRTSIGPRNIGRAKRSRSCARRARRRVIDRLGKEDKMTRSQPRKREAEPLKSATPSHRRNRNANAKHIELVCREIASKFHPDRIILFGSRAYGKPRPESDIDLLIVMPYEGSPFKQAGVIIDHLINTVGIVPIDLFVRTSKELQARIRMGDRFISEIMKRGRVMYEANHQ